MFVIPVAEELDLKKAAKAVGEKSIVMLPQKELLPLTGYIHGGLQSHRHEEAVPYRAAMRAPQTARPSMSARGRSGYQVQLSPGDRKRCCR